MTSRRLQREDPEQRRPARGPPAAAGAGVLAAELPELVGVDGADAADRGRLPAHRGQRRPRGLGALRPRARCRTTGGASSWPSATRDRRIGFGEHKGEPAWQKVPGRVPGRAAAADRHPGRHRAGLASSSSATSAPPRRACTTCATCSRSTSRRAGTCGRWSTCCTPTSAARAARRPRSCCTATPAARTRRASSARSTRRRRTGCRSSCSPTSPTGTASTSSAR